MSDKKKFEVKGMDEALAAVPEEERESLREEIEKMFSNFDPNNPPGQPLIMLPEGQKTCPNCMQHLTLGPKGVALTESEIVDILDCEDCDQGYMVPATN